MRREILIIACIVVLLIAGIFVYNKFFITGKSVSSQEIEVIPLSTGEREKIVEFLEAGEFIEDMPAKGVISLRFFSFKDGKRVWHDDFLIGKDHLLSNGKPDIYLTLHSKYISEFKGENLCDVVKKANKNGGLGFYSELGKTRLLIKYVGMLKHRKCFGF